MKIYHGSIEQICSLEIREPNRRLDYGAGFYATTSYEQAERWVQRKMRESKTCKGYVNIYEFDKQAMYTLKTLSFPTPTAEWVDFVMLNRTKQDIHMTTTSYMVLLPMIMYTPHSPSMKGMY